LDGQLRQQLGDIRREKVRIPIQVPSTTAGSRELYLGGNRSVDGQSEEVVRVLIQNKEEIRKRSTTEGLLRKAEEDLRLLRYQMSSASASRGAADQQSGPPGPGTGPSGPSGLSTGPERPSASSHPSSHSQSPAQGLYTRQTANTTDVGSEMLCLLREATLSSSGGNFGRNTNLIIDGYGSKSTNSDLAGFYLLLYIRQHAGLFRRRTNLIEDYPDFYQPEIPALQKYSEWTKLINVIVTCLRFKTKRSIYSTRENKSRKGNCIPESGI
jgi:hypothetical protein